MRNNLLDDVRRLILEKSSEIQSEAESGIVKTKVSFPYNEIMEYANIDITRMLYIELINRGIYIHIDNEIKMNNSYTYDIDIVNVDRPFA